MNKLRFYWKWYTRLLLAKCGLYDPWKGKEGTLTCLVLHGVCQNYQAYINGRFIRDAELDSFIRILQRKVSFVSLKQVLENELDPKRPNVLLTFDDGYRNNLSLALPILTKHQVPAVICVTGQQEPLWMDILDLLQAFHPSKLQSIYKKLGIESNQAIKKYVGQLELNEMLLFTEQLRGLLSQTHLIADQHLFVDLLTEDEMIKLNAHPLIELVNHGFHHAHAESLSDVELLEEFEKMKIRLENIHCSFTDVIALPFGKLSAEQSQYLFQNGFKHQLMMDEKYSHKYQISRITYNPFFSPKLNSLVLGNGGFH